MPDNDIHRRSAEKRDDAHEWAAFRWAGLEELLAYYEAHDGYRMHIRMTRAEMDGLNRQDLERTHPDLLACEPLVSAFARAANDFVLKTFMDVVGGGERHA